MKNGSKVLGALLIGAATGAVIGVLFAPDKGNKTRKKIAKKADSLIDDLSDKIEEGKEALSDLRKKAVELKDGLKSKLSGVEEEVESHAKHSRNSNHSH